MKNCYQAKWHWSKEEEQLVKSLCIGYTLNFPCGTSQIGDIRADKDKSVNPDVVADLRAPEFHFKKQQFDTVVCDPPFSFYALDKIPYWIYGIMDLAKKRVIFRAPLVNLQLPKKNWKRDYFITIVPSALSLNMFHVYTFTNSRLLEVSS